MEEIELLKLKNKDHIAWKEFVDKNWKKVYYQALLYSNNNKADAEELTRDAFREFWENIDNFKDNCQPSTYMIKTIKWRAIDEWRRRKRFISIDEPVIVDGEEVEFQLPDPKVNVEERIIEEEKIIEQEKTKKQVRKIIIEQKNLCGLLLMLKLFKPQMSDIELSQILDMSVENIRVQRHRCLKSLRKLFQSKGITLYKS